MLQDLCEDMERENQITPQFQLIIDKVKELGDLSKPFLESLNDMKDVTNTTFIQEIQNKIDTIFRKSYQIIQ
jgi:hypothetical protein